VAVNVEKIRLGNFEVAPLVAVGRHSNRRADLQITRAALCGVSMQGVATLLPGGLSFETTLAARDQPIGESIACLTQRKVRMTGNFDFDARLRAKGEVHGIVRDLQGDFSITARNGRILEFDALDRVFSVVNVSSIAAGKLPDLKQQGMGYSAAKVRGTIDRTTIVADELALNADSVTVAGRGSADYATGRIEGTILVAPLPTVNWIASKIPVLGNIFGTTIVAMPVRVSGKLDNPVVVPLGPEAIAERLTDILSNTLLLPRNLIRVIPVGDARGGSAPAPTR